MLSSQEDELADVGARSSAQKAWACMGLMERPGSPVIHQHPLCLELLAVEMAAEQLEGEQAGQSAGE